MSNNKEFIDFLRNIQYSSVSNINLKYNKVFKEYSIEALVERDKFKNSIKKKWMVEEDNKTKSKIITTNDKLKQIINSHKEIYEIQQAFFKTFDKEPLFKKLINKQNKTKGKFKRNLISKSNRSEDKLNSLMKIKTNIRKKDDSFYKRRWEENNRKPPLGLYNPRYNYIEKHIPSINFHKQPTISKKTISNQDIPEIEKEQPKSPKNNSSTISVNSIFQPLTPDIKIKNNFDLSLIDSNKSRNSKRSKDKFLSLNTNKNRDNVFISQLNLSSKEKIDINKNEKIPFNYTPKIIEKNIPVPIFDKMSQRFKIINKSGINPNLDYSPNYNAIFSNAINFQPIDYEKKRKYNYLKKLMTNYHPNTEYELFPQLNIRNVK